MAGDTLKTLIRLNRFDVDEKRRSLQALLDHEAEIQQAIRNLEEELAAEQKVAADAEVQQAIGAVYGGYAVANKERKEAQLEKLAELYPQIESARAALAEAFANLKKYEIARQNRQDEEAAEEARKEGLELDELGLAGHRRNGGRQA